MALPFFKTAKSEALSKGNVNIDKGAIADLLKKKGIAIIGIDTNSEKISLINQGTSPIKDPEIVADLKTTSLSTTTDFSSVKDTDIIIICLFRYIYPCISINFITEHYLIFMRNPGAAGLGKRRQGRPLAPI